MSVNYEQMNCNSEEDFSSPFERKIKVKGFNEMMNKKNRLKKYLITWGFLFSFVILSILAFSKASTLKELQMKKNKIEIENNIIYLEIQSLKPKIAEKEEKLTKLKKEEEQLDKTIENLKRMNERYSQEYKENLNKINEYKERVKKADEEIDQLTKQEKDKDKELKRLQDEISQEEQTIKEIDAKILQIKKQLIEFEKEEM